jgi:hypothetical protein
MGWRNEPPSGRSGHKLGIQKCAGQLLGVNRSEAESSKTFPDCKNRLGYGSSVIAKSVRRIYVHRFLYIAINVSMSLDTRSHLDITRS